MDKLTNEAIIETAEKMIVNSCKTDVSIPQLARKMGVTHAAIYKHFDNKQKLWEAVAQRWFNENIFAKIKVDSSIEDPKAQLHDWLWQFVNAKKEAYLNNEKMFVLNTKYVDNDPYALSRVLTSSYQAIGQIMAYPTGDLKQAETILAAFSIFTLPNFKEFWTAPDYQKRFEEMWNLIESGL